MVVWRALGQAAVPCPREGGQETPATVAPTRELKPSHYQPEHDGTLAGWQACWMVTRLYHRDNWLRKGKGPSHTSMRSASETHHGNGDTGGLDVLGSSWCAWSIRSIGSCLGHGNSTRRIRYYPPKFALIKSLACQSKNPCTLGINGEECECTVDVSWEVLVVVDLPVVPCSLLVAILLILHPILAINLHS